MKILEFMSFNPSWFLTLPGILITSGVVLLLIALILLLTSGNKKGQESGKEEQGDFGGFENMDANTASSYPQDSVTNAESLSIPQGGGLQPATILESAKDNSIPSIETLNVDTPVSPVLPQSEVEPVLTPNEHQYDAIPKAEELATQVQAPDNITSNINQPVVEEIIANEPTTTMASSEEIAPQAPQQVSIYGGVSPSTTIYQQASQPAKSVIYGGADPLESTGSIPKIENIDSTPEPIPAPQQTSAISEEPVLNAVEPISIMNQAPSASYQPEIPIESSPQMPSLDSAEVETLDF